MVSKIEFQTGQKILDLGCGYGVIGIYAAHFSGAENVTMVDINPIAIELTKKNAIYNNLRSINIFQSDGLNNIIEQDFDLILSNPPYHADFNVPKNFIENGYYIFISQKRAIRKTKIKNKQKLSKKLQHKYSQSI